MKRKIIFRFLLILAVMAIIISAFIGTAMANDVYDRLTRLYGEDRFETAKVISLYAYDQADTVIIARGDVLFDALAGSTLAGALDAPILLTMPENLPGRTQEAIAELGAANAVILGGEAAVSQPVFERLDEDFEMDVRRYEGENRFETAAEIARGVADELDEDFGDEAFIVSGIVIPDALTIGSYASASGKPILLVRPDGVPEETDEVMNELELTKTTIIGGPAVVSDEVEDKLPDTRRVYGANRLETSVEVAKEYFHPPETVIFAGGLDENLVDAMAGSYLGGMLDAPILYCHGRTDDSVALNYFYTIVTQDTMAYILGGTAAVSEDCEEAIYIGLHPDKSP